MATIKHHSPIYLWARLSEMEKVIWASAYAHAAGSASARARKADQTVRTLSALEQLREGDIGPEYDAARSNVMLDLPEFEAWYRVQLPVSRGSSAHPPSKDQCAKAYERYRRGLGDFY
ncbi:hypothetical protein [Dyella telluris]|uniref:Uncharacterized protein n=1 Tax=Dyella telluris TaxID=2763498 RepID=A0A7G8Q9L2_9GAMM|nr:hypothetical protein [Dyella telluris]QNK03470.1 hypothetical protein H8F01_10335 [Dyella telluris]